MAVSEKVCAHVLTQFVSRKHLCLKPSTVCICISGVRETLSDNEVCVNTYKNMGNKFI